MSGMYCPTHKLARPCPRCSTDPTPNASRPALAIPKEVLTDQGFRLCERLLIVSSKLRQIGPNHDSVWALALSTFREHLTTIVRRIDADTGDEQEKMRWRSEYFSARDHGELLLLTLKQHDPGPEKTV